MTTSNRGTTAAIEKKNMELARRNVQICEAKAEGETGKAIAMQYGLAQSTISVVLQQGLEYWQEWERRAVEAGVLQDGPQEVAGDPDNRGITMLPIDSIAPNPWQPRDGGLDENQLTLLAEDIYRNGLLSPILVRENGQNGKYELVYGQRRLEAFRYWDALEWDPDQADNLDEEIDGRWASRYYSDGQVTRIPAIVRFMSPGEAILASLSENVVRQDLSWLEETRAFRRALDADVGLSQRKLALTVGISPTNMSTRLSMLKLPLVILNLVNDGKLSWTAARELLGFISQTHVHQEELKYVADALPKSRVIKDGRALSAADVRHFMLNAMNHGNNKNKWEHLDANLRYMSLGDGGVMKDPPLFDVERFVDDHFDHLHTLAGRWGEGTLLWTCRGQQWRAEQDKCKEAQRKRDEEESARVAALTKDDDVPEHPEAGLHRRIEGPNYSVPAPTREEVRAACVNEDGERNGEHEWEWKRGRSFLCRVCGLTYEQPWPEPKAVVVTDQKRQQEEGGQLTVDQYRKQQARALAEEPVGQQQDLSMAAVPDGNTEPNVVFIDRTQEEVKLDRETLDAIHAVYTAIERSLIDDEPFKREDLWTLVGQLGRARNAILPQLQGSFPDDAA